MFAASVEADSLVPNIDNAQYALSQELVIDSWLLL